MKRTTATFSASKWLLKAGNAQVRIWISKKSESPLKNLCKEQSVIGRRNIDPLVLHEHGFANYQFLVFIQPFGLGVDPVTILHFISNK